MSLPHLIEKYQKLGIAMVIDFEKFNHISLVHHSTKIEGSTLTEVEAQVLISEGLTPKGKPIEHSLMVTDHFSALNYILSIAKEKQLLTISFIQQINAMVMKHTGKLYHTPLGNIDASTGAFRKGNVSAGVSYFPNYDKVEKLTIELVATLNNQLKNNLSIEDQIELAFEAHFKLVSIHPFYDGNGRTSRLLMNYIQAYFQLPLAIVYNESKADYIQALIDARQNNNISIFTSFMRNEYAKLLEEEILKYERI
jgi:Fic family protein